MPKSKIVYSFNEFGYFAGESTAWESPLEPDIYHLPSLSTEKKPVIKEGEIPKWNGEKWVYEKIPELTQEPELSKETTEQKKVRIKSELVISRKAFFEISTKDAIEYLLASQDYPEKQKRQRAKQEIEDIKAATTLSALNEFSIDFE